MTFKLTLELLLVLAVLVCAAILAFAGHLSDGEWMLTSAIVVGAYAIGQGIQKRG